MNTIRNYILVDDDPMSNWICAFYIEKALGKVTIHSFERAAEALAFIENEFCENPQPTILFLDINMPVMNGWDFLEYFDDCSDTIKNNISIYMLSSSINNSDFQKARTNRNVNDFISKPLGEATIMLLAQEQAANGHPLP